MSILDEICARKKDHVAKQKILISLDVLKTQIKDAPEPKGFIDALKTANTPAIIAEVKKASPSKGVIRPDFDPVQIAKIYEENGATCISVLTDEPYFHGKDKYLNEIKMAVSLPLLRKDFIIDPYQIYESRALGADCILLIMSALSDKLATELYSLANELDMDVLVEVHNKDELKRALSFSPKMIGVNNRNLKTLEVNLQTSYDLAKNMPNNILKISESGISNKNTINKLTSAGYHGFLIGESLMRQNNIAMAIAKLSENN
ncbi:MAG: indole-3-glycerol phosphate synthase TrpC [Alphaproteobacteria bacterium]|nr:indole-3-glycerol phosphate synthase TrpC [Alphaproteobacteria bacterium]